MNKKLIISLGLLVVLTAAAVLINFDKSADASYFTGSNLPISTDGTNITVSGGNGSVTADAFIYSSDLRLKDNVTNLSGALDKVKNLNGVSFDWKKSGAHEIGLIAQNVEQVVPELVVTGQDGMKAVKYGNIVALLIEAIKEQQVEIEALQSQIAELK